MSKILCLQAVQRTLFCEESKKGYGVEMYAADFDIHDNERMKEKQCENGRRGGDEWVSIQDMFTYLHLQNCIVFSCVIYYIFMEIKMETSLFFYSITALMLSWMLL